MDLDLILFFVLAVVAVASALAMLVARNPVYSAIFLILNFSTIAVFYLLLFAPFIALVQIAVYAGAIMVLFLFVIMLLGGQEIRARQEIPWQQPLAIFLGMVLLAEIVFLFVTRTPALPAAQEAAAGFGSPTEIGLLLFTDYLLPFQITGILLLVAMVGAIVISLKERMTRGKIVISPPIGVQLTSGNGSGARVFDANGKTPASEAEDQAASSQPSAGRG
jgi:NADH-quinone oxidoreductase subunit J